MNGAVIYRGPSRIDGKPIVVIATGLTKSSTNPKTGDMVQTWILREDISPMDALRTGADVSICGGCVHRPREALGHTYKGRSCYVNPFGFSSVWKAYKRGSYPEADPKELAHGKFVRLGSYGDPAAVPVMVWMDLLEGTEGHTGYTHQYTNSKLHDVLAVCQLSADSLFDATHAKDAGQGSFRVLAEGEEPAPWEMLCPASEEAGRTMTCNECLACSGSSGANVAIYAHGIGAGQYEGRQRRTLPVLQVAS